MEKIDVTNENFEMSILQLKSKSFHDVLYEFYFDKLLAKNKQYLLNNDLSKYKDKFIIHMKVENKDLIKKYKHQIRFLERDLTLFDVLNLIFEGKKDKTYLMNQLSKFENRHIFIFLESTAEITKKLSKTLSDIDKYIYSQYFKQMVLYNCYGLGCKVQYRKRE